MSELSCLRVQSSSHPQGTARQGATVHPHCHTARFSSMCSALASRAMVDPVGLASYTSVVMFGASPAWPPSQPHPTGLPCTPAGSRLAPPQQPQSQGLTS